MIDWEALRAPFPADDVEWRLQSCGKKGDKVWALCLAYITNRAIQQRLDDVVGPENWQNEFTTGPHGGVICGISIKCGNEWVRKWDGAENTQVEAVKGGLSDAMKRAGYQWGIGRYLYKLEEGFAKVHDNGAYRGKTKDDIWFKWDPPALPTWALPAGAKPQTKTEAADKAIAAAKEVFPGAQEIKDNPADPRQNHYDRIEIALQKLHGADRRAKDANIVELTAWTTKEGKEIKGTANYKAMKQDWNVSKLCKELEALAGIKPQEKEICNDCRQPIVNGRGHGPSCPNIDRDPGQEG